MADSRRTLESAAYFTRGGDPPAPDHDADNASRSARVAVEQSRLLRWAKENGLLGSPARLPPAFAKGGEHQVYFRRGTQRYVKATLPDRQRGYGIALGSYTHGAVPSEYLDRLDLQNRIFHDDIRLECIVPNEGNPIIITSQPFIRGTESQQSLIDELMGRMGYEKLADGAYYDEQAGLLMFDLFPRNVIQARDGHLYPIDPVIQRIAPDFGQFLREEPHTINLRR